MGRKKIQIQRITDERNRQVTFTKRKFGLMKKAYELSVLCDCEIALIIFNHSNKLFQYASTDMDKVLLKYTEYNEPHESRTNADIIETLRKKGFNGCESPEPDGEDSIDQSPLNDDKYRKTTEDLDILFKRYGVSSAIPPPTFSMPVTVQASNQNTLQFSNPGNAMVTTSYVTSPSLSDNHHLSPQQPALQRNTVSPGLPQRPASAGAMLGGDLNNSNGGCPSPVPNGYVSARASPGLLSVSNGNSLGKVVPAKSPPPPQSPQMVNSRKPDLRVITSQGGKSLMQMNAQRLAGAQMAQALTTPVVSVTTPSLLAQGLPFSAMPTAYNTEYQLTSADITALHALASPGGLLQGNVSWQQQPSLSQQQQQQQQQQLSLASLSNLVMWGMDKQSGDLSSQISSLAANLRPVGHIPQGTMLTVNTNSNMSIKSEPISPGRDRRSPCPPPSSSGGGVQTAAPPPQYPGSLLCLEPPTGRSPADSLSSNGSSYEGNDRDDPAAGGGGGIGGSAVGNMGNPGRSLPPEFSPSVELLRAQNEAEQEGANIKRMRLDAWVT
ncbi:myocyte-specific enhancer factor 2D homolog isoform X2 [Salvelinus namaycush]|uniref:Myocyte-specific enhancer factor 2D homolog isoform X2 n=1 Tax=Salvelinus namaycush TaxID=8040 RepID=A0A8U0PLU6_SALNM|nr:myocyte-specific enhancer factor 2D homolog isoform X2 [Salvelinus namaycush]